jgi:hypothetical protein
MGADFRITLGEREDRPFTSYSLPHSNVVDAFFIPVTQGLIRHKAQLRIHFLHGNLGMAEDKTFIVDRDLMPVCSEPLKSFLCQKSTQASTPVAGQRGDSAQFDIYLFVGVAEAVGMWPMWWRDDSDDGNRLVLSCVICLVGDPVPGSGIVLVQFRLESAILFVAKDLDPHVHGVKKCLWRSLRPRIGREAIGRDDAARRLLHDNLVARMCHA